MHLVSVALLLFMCTVTSGFVGHSAHLQLPLHIAIKTRRDGIRKVSQFASSLELPEVHSKLALFQQAFTSSPPTSSLSLATSHTLSHLKDTFKGQTAEALVLWGLNSAVPLLSQKLSLSSTLGFMLSGLLLGPHCLNMFKLHTVDSIGEYGILLFLFEMGLELSFKNLLNMKRDMFGLGCAQFILSIVLGIAARLCGLSSKAALIVGCSLALSSSPFVLQLLKDSNAMKSDHAESSFGILLFQDLSVIPMLVVLPLLASSGTTNYGFSLLVIACKALVAVILIGLFGATLLPKYLDSVVKTENQEAIMATMVTLIATMAAFTHGLGLSESLGVFTIGKVLSESKHRHLIESIIAPLRTVLLSLFFVRVGCEIDPRFVLREFGTLMLLLIGLIGSKVAVIKMVCNALGKPSSVGTRCGLVNSHGGEFAFVGLKLAESSGLISTQTSQLLLTSVALSMVVTPFLVPMSKTPTVKVKSH